MAATEKKWYVGEDGCISVCEFANSVTYHSALNSIIVSTKEPSVKIYDVASGALLKKSDLSASCNDAVGCLYLPETDRIVFCDDYAVGVRSDLRGMLLLDTALQSAVAKPEDEVKVEIPLTEGTQLLKCLMSAELPGVEHVEDIVKELEKAVDVAQEATKGNLKTAKWATVSVVLPHCVLKGVCSSLVTEMKRLSLFNPGLSVASAISDRLTYLLPSTSDIGSGPVERAMMYSEATRRETFRKWPHMNYKWALPDPMAQAGFYHQPNSIGDDRAMCFTCNVCLVCWEPTDEPWSEHERHSPSCPFVKGEYTQNVPLCVTYASQPAKVHGEKPNKIECLSTTSSDEFVATSTLNGKIVVWKVDRLIKKYCQFNLDPTETAIAVKTGIQIERTDDKEAQSPSQIVTPEGAEGIPCDNIDSKAELAGSSSSSSMCPSSEDPVYEIPLHEKVDKTEITKTRTRPSEDVKVKSLCVLRKKITERQMAEKEKNHEKSKKKSRTHPQPTLICGVSLRRTRLSLSNNEVQNAHSELRTDVQLMNKVNEVVSNDSHPRIIDDSEVQDEDGCQKEIIDDDNDEVLSATSFVPYILVLATKDNRKKVCKTKEKESKKLSTSVSTSSLNVPTLGSITMDHDWGILDPMFDSDPDPDCQIIGITPGPTCLSVESPTGTKSLSEGDLNSGQGSINDLLVSGSGKSSTKIRAGTVLQCIELPVEVQTQNLEVTGITPTLDGQHIIVSVTPVKTVPLLSMSVINAQDKEGECDAETENIVSESDVNISVSKETDSSTSGYPGGCLLVYKVNYTDKYVNVDETPVMAKFIENVGDAVTSVLVLPHDVSGSYEEEDDQGLRKGAVSSKSKPTDIHGQLAVTLACGKFWLLNICDLQIIAEVSPPEYDKFVSTTYCTGIERLCVCTSGGKLHFYQLCEQNPPQPDLLLDSPDGVYNGSEISSEVDLTTGVNEASTDQVKETNEKSSSGSDLLLVNQSLNLDNLIILHNLIQFENLMPRFTATVPPCWTEIQQEQQQRRHPQHLQHQGEATQHTRTWKLQPDSLTWDEHLFEIVLPRPCCVGHVDLKFTLHPGCTLRPDVQVTLLKQNITSIGRQTNGPSVDVDKVIDFNFVKSTPSCSSSGTTTKTDKVTNRVLDPSFLESHNAEILCGPINISSCLDLSGNGGLITLTSPQLLVSKPKAFLLHVKGFIQNGGKPEEKCEKQKVIIACSPIYLYKVQEPKKKMPFGTAAHSSQKMKVMKTAFDNDIFMPSSIVKESGNMQSVLPRPRYTENFKGCDWIQEMSITIRKTKKTWLPKERLQRNAMLDNAKFHEKLIAAASLSDVNTTNGISSDQWQNMVLDILMWITAVQMNDPSKRHISKPLPSVLQEKLPGLVKACFVQGTRTTAHKCARLMVLCMEHCKYSSDPDLAPTFSYSLLQSLLESLSLLPCANSAGAVKWFFIMLNRVKCMDVGTVAQACTDLLINASKHYSDRLSPLHSLLKARFGLYGHPFDTDLFDTELPMAMRQPIPSSSYASVTSSGIQSAGSSSSGNNNNNMTSSSAVLSSELDFYDLFNPPTEKSAKMQLEYAKSNIFGLLEVEPLHFTCHSTSDGTKMERYDNSSVTGGHGGTVNPAGISGTINFGEGIPVQPSSMASASANTSTLANLSSSMSVTKQQLQELSSKTYPTIKHKIMHIKQILSEVGKSLPQESMAKYTSEQLFPPTPKTTPQVMTPSFTPPNENQTGGNSEKMESSGVFVKQPSQQQHQQQQPFTKTSPTGVANSQTLLQQPPLQVLVIERMHSGARRFVILDFGKPIVLSDVIIPACADLASLSIDVWVQGEEIDGQRLTVASDIGLRSLVMNDIMPATVCRYLKITTIGRYGSGSTRSKIPIGAFYGHSCILPWEWNYYMEQRNSTSGSITSEAPTQSQLVGQLSIYMSLLEDIQCRYSLARTRLEILLASIDTQQYVSSHVQYFLKKNKKSEDDNNILEAYQDCLQLQLQQNLAQRAANRLHTALGFQVQGHDFDATLSTRLRLACTDKLRFLQENLLDTLLSMTGTSKSIPQPPMSLYNVLNPQTAETLFKYLCVHGTKKIQIGTGMLLMRVCGSQPWWGNFLGNVLEEFFHSENTQTFTQDRVFVLLLAMGQKALSGQCAIQIMDSLLDMLARVLSPLIEEQQNMHSNSGMVDLTLVGWILLFLCRSLDPTALLNSGVNGDDNSKVGKREYEIGTMQNRWNFIQGDHNALPSKSRVKSTKLYRWSMHKRLQHHKQRLMDLQQAQKTFFASQADKSGQSTSNTLLKQQEKQFKKELSQYTSKHIKDIISMRRTDAEILRKINKYDDGTGSGKTNYSDSYEQDVPLLLPKEKVLLVIKGLMALLLNMDFTCNVDLFLITCKVLATICVTTRPAIKLSEAMTQEQLEGLVLLASNLEFSYGSVSWGGPWAGHAITSLLQDILDGEKFYPVQSDTGFMPEECMGTVTETDDSLTNSMSLPTLEETEPDLEPSSIDTTDMDLSEGSDPASSKMVFDKESSLMVDLLLDEGEYDDDTSDKLHAYVTGEHTKAPPMVFSNYDQPTATVALNGTVETNSLTTGDDKKFISKLTTQINKQIHDKVDKSTENLLATSNRSGLSAAAQGISTALDARLEFGLETQAELRLKVVSALHAENVQQAFSSSVPMAPSVGHTVEQVPQPLIDDELTETNSSTTGNEVSSTEMLSLCYEHLFSSIMPQLTDLDALLQLWLTLNCESSPEGTGSQLTFDPSRAPIISLSKTSVARLLELVAHTQSLPICTWVLILQALTLLANQKIPHQDREQSMVVAMLCDPNLIVVIKNFLTSTSELGPVSSAVNFTQVGPSAIKSFYEFLLRLQVKCAPESLCHLKEVMLKLVYTLCAEKGAFHCSMGPLDAQCKFLDFILDMNYDQVEISNAISVIESISMLVHQHIICQERVLCRSSSENSVNARSCFGGLFASLLRGGDSRSSSGDVSRDMLMSSLLRLVNSLLQIKRPAARNSRLVSIMLDNTVEQITPTTNVSMSEPVPDSAKLCQALATSTPTSAFTMSDEERGHQTDEQKTETLHERRNGQASTEVFNYQLADIILSHSQIMCNFIVSLSYCNSNTMATILGSRGISSQMQETFTVGDPISVGDGIYQILLTLTRNCSDQTVMLESIFRYISGSHLRMANTSLCRLSEPLLWFVLKVLETPQSIQSFVDMGGVEVICRNLVNSNSRIISTSPSLISTIMQNLNGKSKIAEKRLASLEIDSADGMQNFAPLGSISSSSPTASPADILIQSAPTHRRARSAAWSYRFYPDEAWVDLTIQLPFAILLKEVQIQQYSTSLTTCPAYVSLEISHDGLTTKPLCQPLLTSSLAFIKLQLQRPEVSTTVVIRLHKARDSMTIGLSKIRIMGTSAFGGTGVTPQNVFMPTDDFVSKSSVRWIRLLHHCLTAHKEKGDRVAAAAAPTPNLLNTCSALLVSPLSSLYASNIETVLLRMGLHSVEMGLALIDNILRSPFGQSETGSVMSPFLGKVSGLANDSTVELLYQLGTLQDSGTHHRVKALLQWLGDSARIAMQKTAVYSDEGYRRIPHQLSYPSLPSPAPAHIHCVAAILWQSHELPVEYNLSQLITKDLVSSLFEWSVILKVDSALKKAVDYVLCAFCHIQPECFSQLLVWMGIIITGDNSMAASICDDRKDHFHQSPAGTAAATAEDTSLSASICDDRKDSSNLPVDNMMTDDSKEANNVHSHSPNNHFIEIPQSLLQEFRHISLEEAHLSTLALACKSPVAIKQLLDSGFPAVLAQGLFEFCSGVISKFSDHYLQPEVMTDTSKTMSDEVNTASQSRQESSDGKNIDKASWITADMVAAVLHFFAEVSSEAPMKDWIGGAEGNIFWPALLTMLCNTSVQTATIPKGVHQGQYSTELLSIEDRTSIETASVRFFTQVISCHIVNQLLFAKVLCEVIKEQSAYSKTTQGLGNFPLSGFTRCLFLQALLEDEKILVVFKVPHSSQNNLQQQKNISPVEHPKHSGGREFQSVVVSLHTTCTDLLAKVADAPNLPEQFLEKAAEKSDESKKDMASQCAEMTDYIASGIVAKERREKEEKDKASGKSLLPPRPPTRRGRHTMDTMASQFQIPVLSLYHSKIPNRAIPGDMTLSQLLQVLHQRGLQQGHSVIEFTVKVQSSKKDSSTTYLSDVDDWEDSVEEEILDESVLSATPSFPTSLQVFASVGGLALLAEHLPLLYPDISRQPLSPADPNNGSGYCKTVSNSADLGQDWVTIEPFPEEFYELYEPVSPAPAVSRPANPAVSMPTIPPHSLIAFGLFLRLPGYAEVLLKERKKAQCLLRLVLGVTDDGDGGHILTSPIASSLPTLPFLVLKSLYESTPLTTDDGVLLRRMSLEIWVIHLILACLSVLSHHAPRVNIPGFQQEAQLILSAMQSTTTSHPTTVANSTEEKSQQYWAKGTGFGTGSTTSSWDAEQALLRQKSEEEHVACLFQVLASFINPGGDIPKDFDSATFPVSKDKMLIPDVIQDLFSQSCLVPSMSSYLRNDSVLDMARHIPLYRALLELLRGISVCSTLVPLLLPLDKENNTDSTAAVGVLLDKMRGCVDTYVSRLKSNKGKNGHTEEEENEGLTLLIPDIQETARIVKIATDRLQKSTESGKDCPEKSNVGVDSQSSKESLDEKYMEIMKELQFDTFEMVVDEGNGIQFMTSHHYENNVKAAGDVNNAARTRRLAQEAVTLSTSLPLSAGSSVFVRCDEERLDVMKVLITGPDDTPYNNGCFEFDVYFPQDYPNAPPYINLETTGNHTVRFNPNLYNDGKVCLSVLNTWHGRPEEKWNSQTSSFLQVLVSIQSLILVSEPYFNEPGYERSRGTPSGTASSREYDANIRQATVKWAMLEQLKNPSPCFKEVIHKHFWMKRHEVLRLCEDWIAEMESYSSDKRTGRNIAHSTLALKKHYNQLREEIAKLKPPVGSEEEDDDEIDPKAMHYSTDSSSFSSASNLQTDSQVPGPSSQPDENILVTDTNSNSVLEDGFC